jgi:hypothetical protein
MCSPDKYPGEVETTPNAHGACSVGFFYTDSCAVLDDNAFALASIDNHSISQRAQPTERRGRRSNARAERFDNSSDVTVE